MKYCCSSSWKTELGGRPRRLAAAPRGPLRAGLLPLLPLLRLRPGLAGVGGGFTTGGMRGMDAGRSWGGGSAQSETAVSEGVGGTPCGETGVTGSAGTKSGKSGSGWGEIR